LDDSTAIGTKLSFTWRHSPPKSPHRSLTHTSPPEVGDRHDLFPRLSISPAYLVHATIQITPTALLHLLSVLELPISLTVN
jgi:hypothetical protein